MFPYPSGSLHLGHIRNYSISNALYKYELLKGNNAIHPLGFDAFGLPAENAAKKYNILAEDWTKQNIKEMTNQLESCKFTFSNTDHIFATTDPEYVERTQQLISLLYKHNLLYKANKEVWWDDVDKTVLANEQVDKEGYSWRSGSKAQRRNIDSWFIRTTYVKDELIKGLDNLNWPKEIKTRQLNWLLKLEDWCISRQRLWGCPFPEELQDKDSLTLDTFVDSSWYWKYVQDSPVDIYVGGSEHATGHLVYARAIQHILYQFGYSSYKEPFRELLCQGMILGKTYQNSKTGEYLSEKEYEYLEDKTNIVISYQKMSKSKFNGINPLDLLNQYSPEVLRLYILFLCPLSQEIKWNTDSIKGIIRFLNRVERNTGLPKLDLDDSKLSNFLSYMGKRQLHLAINELIGLSKNYDVGYLVNIFI